MKIANIIEEGRFGGPQHRITEVAKHLKRQGIETMVIFPKHQSRVFENRLEAEDLKHIKLPLHRLTKDKKGLFLYLVFFFHEIVRLYWVFRKERFDIVHCSGGAWQIKGLVAGRLAGVRTLWHLNDTGMPMIVRRFFRRLSPILADGLIVAGERVKKVYVDQLGLHRMKHFECLPPVDTDFFNPSSVAPDLTIQAADGLKIVTVANINPTKGLMDFVRMAALLSQQHKGLSFFIVGSVYDSQRQYYLRLQALKKELCLENLFFYGPCSHVAQVLKATDIFVCTSLSEAGPMSVWEAMSMEKAIVSTDVGEVSRFIKDGHNGLVVRPQDASALAEKISLYIENKDLRELAGQHARKTAVKHLDIRAVAQSHVLAYSAFTSTPNRGRSRK